MEALIVPALKLNTLIVSDEGQMMASDWVDETPSLRSLDAATKTLLRDSVVRKQIPRGAVLFRPGDQCAQFPLIVSGSVRVQRVTESGREIVLYRVGRTKPHSDDNLAALGRRLRRRGRGRNCRHPPVVPADRFNADERRRFPCGVFDGYGSVLPRDVAHRRSCAHASMPLGGASSPAGAGGGNRGDEQASPPISAPRVKLSAVR
jgi:hypothetical protein